MRNVIFAIMAASTTPRQLLMKSYMTTIRSSCEMLTCRFLGVKPIN